MSCPRNKHIFRCDQNGQPARRSEPDWQLEGAYLNRYVTDEQRSRRPIFIATHWAAASWLFFRVARSSRIDLDILVVHALKNSQLTCGERHAYFGDRTLSRSCHFHSPFENEHSEQFNFPAGGPFAQKKASTCARACSDV